MLFRSVEISWTEMRSWSDENLWPVYTRLVTLIKTSGWVYSFPTVRRLYAPGPTKSSFQIKRVNEPFLDGALAGQSPCLVQTPGPAWKRPSSGPDG